MRKLFVQFLECRVVKGKFIVLKNQLILNFYEICALGVVFEEGELLPYLCLNELRERLILLNSNESIVVGFKGVWDLGVIQNSCSGELTKIGHMPMEDRCLGCSRFFELLMLN